MFRLWLARITVAMPALCVAPNTSHFIFCHLGRMCNINNKVD